MSTSAIITMVLVQGTVIAIVAYIYYLVLNPPEDSDDQNGDD